MPRQIGLENLTVAKVSKDDATGTTYAKPLKLERSIKAKISPKTSSEKLYSDDSVEDILNNFDSCDVEIELNQLTIESRALLQGSKVVDGMLIENKDDIAPDIALGFRSKKSNGKYRYVWLLKGKFEHTEDEYETIGEKATPKTNSLKGSFYSRNDGNWRIMEDEDSEGSKPERLKTWFDEVPEIPTETNPEG
jgi:phi13 family phage major tail protein